MSERSKGDVSSRVNNNANRVVKNPLLSASVTGLSYDDFPNKPLLLPAAPPVVHAPPPQPTTALIAGILNREPKTLVTVGQSSSIDDNETLDEINLNASGSDDSAAANSAPFSSNPYQSSTDANANLNPLLEPTVAADSLLSQAASSFGALPSVASNVFSSFSKRIYAGTRETDNLPQAEPQLDIQPTYIQQAGQSIVAPPAAPFYAAPPTTLGEAAPEPPKFYAPQELPNLGTGIGPLPPTATGQNTYRLSARKKVYAPIPGFSEQQQQQQTVPSAVPATFQTPPYPTPSATATFEPPEPAPVVQEERKSGGGLFSLTSLVPTGVLQNISGLVQSATGRTSEPPPPSNPATPAGYFDITTSSTVEENLFAPAPTAVGPPPAIGGYFVPGAAPRTVEPLFNPQEATRLPATEGFLNPQAGPPVVGGFLNPVAPPTIGAFFNPQQAYEAASPNPVGSLLNPQPAIAPSAVGSLFNSQEAVRPPAIGGFFNPQAAPPAVGQFFTPATEAQSEPFAQPPQSIQPPQAAQTLPATQPPPTAQLPLAAQTPPVAQPPPIAQPPPTAQTPPNAQSASAAQLPPVSHPPPVTATAIPPPAAGQSGASYRLQKGTRLYKSPLTAQETTGAFGHQSAYTATPALSAPSTIFNPFGAPQPTTTGVSLYAPTAPTVSPAPSNTEPRQEVPVLGVAPPILFTPQATTTSYQAAPPISASLFTPVPSQELSLFPTATVEASPGPPLYPPTNSNFNLSSFSAPQEVPLFAAPPTSASPQGLPLFPASTAEVISSNSTSAAPQVDFNQKANSAADLAQSLFAHSPGIPTSLFAPQITTEPESRAEEGQEVPLFAAPPTTEITTSSIQELSSTREQNLFEPGPTTSLFTSAPQEISQTERKQEIETIPVSSIQKVDIAEASQGSILFPPASSIQQVSPEASEGLYPPTETAGSDFQPEIPLFVPVPSAVANQGVTPYPPGPIIAAEDSPAIPLFVPVPTDIADLGRNQPPSALKTEPPTNLTTGLFAPSTIVQEEQLPASIPPDSFRDPTVPAAQSISEIFAPGFSSAPASVALTTQTTTTFFNPFAQTITTPLPQDLLPPPIGFVAPSTEPEVNPFEAQTIEPVLPEAEVEAPPLAPPKQTNIDTHAVNPFRKNIETTTTTGAAPSPLQSFFTPAASGQDFNFFAEPQQVPAPVQFPVAAPPLLQEQQPVAGVPTSQSSHALGFEQLIENSRENNYQNSSVNSISGLFGGSIETQASAPTAPPSNFFDHFAASGPQGQQEDQRIQNFFNNPPLQDQPAVPGDLKYDLVHSGLPNKLFAERSQTSVSNQVEPPSSACSEFSTAAPINQAPASESVEPQSESIPVEKLLELHQRELPEEILQQLRMANEKGLTTAPSIDAIVYTPVLLHWFYKRSVDGKFLWVPFSHYDSALLETSLNSELSDSSSIVPVEGGRYDVNIKERTKVPVFWEGKAIEVRRCSWFYKAADSKYVPYAEETAAALELEYKRSAESGEWHKKIPLANGEQVMMHGPGVIVHFMPPANADTWGGTVQTSTRPLVVKRDLNDFKIEQGESQRVDHLLFMVHGIGSACDLKMRNVEEVVDDFRYIAQQLVQSHYKNSTDMGLVGRVEVLPIEWHGHLHSEELGIDEKLKSITLESIPRLRNFTNDTLLDVLFYTSPKYCQKIMNTVADALNEVYLKYRMRHPEFNGGVSLAGHSLGSLILFDLLCHQEALKESEEENKENPDQMPQKQPASSNVVQLPNNDEMLPSQVSYAMGLGPSGTGQPVINYTQLIFHPKKFFALGSPIGMFVTIRGIDKLGLDFRLPTCPGFYNIFHPFDPVAYRIEALINPDMKGIRPVLIPHHKGRKRMHLELKETMSRVGADIKQRFMDTFKTTLDSVNFLAQVTKVKKEAEETLEKEASTSSSHVFQKQIEDQDESSVATTSTHVRNRTDSESTTASDPEFIELDFPLGKLNDAKRVDYVLQEAPLEFINEYIFALSSHVCYWGSEDTILFVMKEIYAGFGISTDSQVPQQSMTIERPSSRTNSVSQSLLPM